MQLILQLTVLLPACACAFAPPAPSAGWVQSLVDARIAHRARGRFDEADSLKDQLEAAGIKLQDGVGQARLPRRHRPHTSPRR